MGCSYLLLILKNKILHGSSSTFTHYYRIVNILTLSQNHHHAYALLFHAFSDPEENQRLPV